MSNTQSQLQLEASEYWSRFNKAFSEQPAKKQFLLDRDMVQELISFFERVSNRSIEVESVGRI